MARVPKSELCTVCRSRVYPMDALIVDRKKYHKTCFCCELCRNKISLGNYVSLHGHLSCPHHYKQLLTPNGNHHHHHNNNDPGLKPPTGTTSGPDHTEWRHSMSSSVGSVEKTLQGPGPNANKVSVVWPPQADAPKKAFKVEEDIQLTKPLWPPPDSPPKSPQQQHRKAVPKSVV